MISIRVNGLENEHLNFNQNFNFSTSANNTEYFRYIQIPY